MKTQLKTPFSTLSANFLPTMPEDVALRARLIMDAGLRDAWVARRTTQQGAIMRLAYVEAEHPWELPDPLLMDHPDLIAVPLTRLPRTDEGMVDTEELGRMAVITPDLIDGLGHWGLTARYETNRDMPWPEPEDMAPAQETDHVRRDIPAFLDGGPLPEHDPELHGIGDVLKRAETQFGEQEIRFLDRNGITDRISYCDLYHQALRVAAGFAAAGVQPGDQMITVFHETEDRGALLAFWGAALAGVLPVPVQRSRDMLIDDPLSKRIQDAVDLLEKAHMICSLAMREKLTARFGGRVLPAVEQMERFAPLPNHEFRRPSDPVALFLTSGSTSKPKVVVQTHGAFIAQVTGTCAQNHVTADDVSLNWLPLDHLASIVMIHMRDMYAGATQYRGPCNEVLRDPLLWLDWMSDHAVTNGWAPNFGFNLVVNELEKGGERAWNLSQLRFLINAGETVIRRTAIDFHRHLARFGVPANIGRPCWGMTETSSGCVFALDYDIQTHGADTGPCPVGVPSPGVRVRITDPVSPTTIMMEGENGLLQLSGATILREYLANPEQNRKSFTEDGWFDTGDLGTIRNGALYLTGRSKEVLIVNGLNIDPGEVETIVNGVSGVRPSFSAVLSLTGGEDEAERIAVFYVPEDAAERTGVMTAIRKTLSAKLGLPVDIMVPVTDHQIPKTSIGKIQKSKLRAAFAAGELVAAWQAPRTAATPAQEGIVLLEQDWIPVATCPAHCTGASLFIGPEAENWADRMRARGMTAYAMDGDQLCRVGLNQPVVSRLVILPGAAGNVAQRLQLVQRLMAWADVWPTRLFWIEPGLLGGPDGRAPHKNTAMTAALLRSAAAEIAGLHVRMVDPGEETLTPSRMFDELCDPASVVAVAWDGSGRYQQRLRRLTRRGAAGATLKQDACYLITGGLGGIGFELASYLQNRYQSKLILIGRSNVTDPLSSPARRLAALRRNGPVEYVTCDLADLDIARSQLTRLRCDGIFHLACRVDPCALSDITADRLTAVLAVKSCGSEILLAAADTMGAKWLVNFSSLNGTFGGANHAAYAMASRYQQAMAGQCTPGGCRTISLNWSMWHDTGASVGFQHEELTRRRGYQVLDRNQALWAFEAALIGGATSVYIGIDPRRAPMAGDVKLPVRALGNLVVPTGTVLNHPLSDPFGTPISIVFASEKPSAGDAKVANEDSPLATALCDLWQDILSLSNRPHSQNDIFDLGATSLDLPRAHARIEDMIGRKVNILDLFTFPVISDLAENITQYPPAGSRSRRSHLNDA